MSQPLHESFMRRALEVARRGWGDTHPNPLVGALIVEDGVVVAEGFHAKAGEPHAEVSAIRALGRKPAQGATLYVTLEPCCTHGRTPPCCEAITVAGLTRVVIGATDPNPVHAGKGFEL
ncbi:MAG TPA: bifunctional diaminohydroxyphosphoribosylaminopyrimidine deaminase/5-amino-6-(5-phosphoribosylamino)uracil reductase RibD, partial [Lacunisphaera sp.]|nr:bifunctional diaminohydroxyphosphoribosylaminopyrimidine deaminase/5-amino-6-(5-phosphoribosylamino)uracil reductase RibD [Lacunisphaera sp.]